jgi:pseudouridine-5'-phosphate glycosidase
MAAGPLRISDEVHQALVEGRPVVALESSIVAQGFPRPQNHAVGREMAAAVRAGGAVPAQVAVIDGAVVVGLDDGELVRLANQDSFKCSARDLGATLASGALGATTVAATARIAAMAGIRVFATGGIGGVHPGAGLADVSADLMEIARAPVAVVCSGAKSILDLAATLETLETFGVPVLGYGVDEFPAFHTGESGLRLEHRIDDAAAAASLLVAHWSLEGAGGLVLCNPPPPELALPAAELDRLLAAAAAEAAAEGVRGGALTPFLLRRLNALSEGRTLAVNHALAVANAGLAAMIASAYAALVETSRQP